MAATQKPRRFRPHQRGRPLKAMHHGIYVTFMMDEVELEALEEWAYRLRRSRSAHIRRLLLEAMANSEIPIKTDPDAEVAQEGAVAV